MEVGKVIKGPFFFFFYFWKRCKFVLGLPKLGIFYREKSQEKQLCPSEKYACYATAGRNNKNEDILFAHKDLY